MPKISVGKLISRAQSHIKKGETLKAKELYELVLKHFPKNNRARIGLSTILADGKTVDSSCISKDILEELVSLYSENEFHSVVDKIENLLPFYPNELIPWEIFGASAAQIGKMEQAIFAFQAATKIEPKNPEMYYNLGTAHKQAGNLEASIEAFSTAINLKPDHVLALNNIGTVFKEKKMLDRAIAVYQKAISINPNYAFAYNNLGVALVENEKFVEAIAAYNQAINIQGDYFEAYYNLAHALRKINQLEASIEASKNALAINPNFPEAMTNIGNVLQEQGKLSEATLWLQEVIKIAPHQASAYFNMGNLLCDKEMLLDAVSCYKKAIQLNPNYVEAYFNLGRIYMLQRMFDEAIIAFSAAIEMKSEYAEAYNSLATCFKELGKLDDAIKYYKLAQKLMPNYADAYFNHGIAMHLQGDLDAAIALYVEALVHKHDYPEAYFNQGLAWSMQGKHLEATSAFKTAISFDPNYCDAYKHLGAAFLAMQDLESAAKAYNDAIDLQPDDAEAYCKLGTALQDLGQYNEASKAYENVLALEPNNPLARNNLGKIHWLWQNFSYAFELMESRWGQEENLIGSRLESSKPTWNGEEGSDLFVWKEQGIGDEVLFSSMFNELEELSQTIIVECDKRLIPLYSRSFPQNIVFTDDRKNINNCDYSHQIAAASLFKHFRNELSNFNYSSSGWLNADTQLINDLRGKLTSVKTDRLIGISWFTKSAGGNSHRRNVSLELLMRHIGQLPVKFVNLQYGVTSEEIRQLSNETGIELINVSEIDLFNDIDGLSALISTCDTVITIDNFTVHLAGALGVETKLLLPALSDVRWGSCGKSTYLYDHVTLYRQETHGGWDAQLAQLVGDLT